MSGSAITTITTQVAASIPSPDQATWYLGPIPLRAYALAIIAGIVVRIRTSLHVPLPTRRLPA